jgi:hypothetical protein
LLSIHAFIYGFDTVEFRVTRTTVIPCVIVRIVLFFAITSQLLKHSLVGKPEDIAQKVRKYIDAGIDQFFLAFEDPFEYEAIQLFMNTVK